MSERWSDPVSYLRHALAQDQFTLYCQPIAALSGIVIYPMAEVLVRLREEEQALLPPGEFLPILEHYGMLAALDRWVVSEAVRRLSNGPEIPRFSVNLSAQTIADPTFPDFFADEIAAARVPADSVLFEVDEFDALALPACMPRLSATLGSLGSGVMIDGYGRAADPLAALKFPCVQYVKVHDSLTRGLASGDAPTARLAAILRLTSQLGVGVIAECVEDQDVLKRLKAMNFRYAQGFGICLPQSIDKVSELPARRLSEREPRPVQGMLDLSVQPQVSLH